MASTYWSYNTIFFELIVVIPPITAAPEVVSVAVSTLVAYTLDQRVFYCPNVLTLSKLAVKQVAFA